MKGAICHVFQLADVLEAWMDTIGARRGIEPLLVAVTDETGAPLMLLPFGIERRHGIRVLTFLDLHVSDYNVPVLFRATPAWTKDEVRALWSRIVAALPAFDLTQLEKMPELVGDKPNPLLHLGARRWPVSSHIAHLSSPWETFPSPRLKSASRNRKFYRQLEKLSPLTYEVARTQADASRTLDILMRQKARRFAETRVPGFESHPGMEDFYREATARLLDKGVAVVAAIKSGDSVLAAQWGLRHGDSYYYLISGYEAGQWQKYSPGRILHEAMLRWCLENGVTIADFGIGDESYKLEYCDEHIALFEVERAMTMRASLHLLAHRTLAALRETSLWKAVRPYKWVLRRALSRKS